MNDTFLTDAKAVTTTALTMTLTLWIKRTLAKVSLTRWCDPSLLHGQGLPRAAPTGHSPSTTRFGPGTISVPGWGRLYYRNVFTTRDGHILYGHDAMLNSYHLGPCPLLRTGTNCEACPWYVETRRYHADPQCAALVRLEEMAEDDAFGLMDTKCALEQSR
ncbi:MAG: hypothetical protein AB7G75_08785 [Candidatus Binatia bacterium]